MSLDSSPTIPATSPDEIRNARGEWRPAYPVRFAPLFTWPPRPVQVLRWALGFPGFLWPWNCVYLGITLATWYFLQPELSRCESFQVDWIAMMFLRNFALLWIVVGGWHGLLYTLKAHGTRRKYDVRWPATNSRTFLFGNQVLDNIFWNCCVACPVWTAYEVLFMWACANHLIPHIDFSTHPVWFVIWLCLIPFWREFHFYWIHRLIHCKPLYKHVHYLHHKNINPGPWSGLAMHPVESILYFSVVLIHFVIPSHPIHLLFNAQHTALTPAAGHHGFEGPLFNGKLPTGSYFHYLHHRYFECNYGESTLPLDKVFGTFRDGLPEGDGANLPAEEQR